MALIQKLTIIFSIILVIQGNPNRYTYLIIKPELNLNLSKLPVIILCVSCV